MPSFLLRCLFSVLCWVTILGVRHPRLTPQPFVSGHPKFIGFIRKTKCTFHNIGESFLCDFVSFPFISFTEMGWWFVLVFSLSAFVLRFTVQKVLPTCTAGSQMIFYSLSFYCILTLTEIHSWAFLLVTEETFLHSGVPPWALTWTPIFIQRSSDCNRH